MKVRDIHNRAVTTRTIWTDRPKSATVLEPIDLASEMLATQILAEFKPNEALEIMRVWQTSFSLG